MSLDQTLRDLHAAFPASDVRLPALFIGHGNPMNAIEDNAFSRAWQAAGAALPRPSGILCISAHWETAGTRVTAMARPKTIHDFGGFPRALFECQYRAPGSPALAQLTQATIHRAGVQLDETWGLDHGAWSVLMRMFPDADIPVIQLSLDRREPPEFHYALGQELAALRNRGVLIIGSGNMVHNLRVAVFEDQAYDWAVEFDATLAALIASGDHAQLIHYERLGALARLAIPTNEHYLPLLYVLATQARGGPGGSAAHPDARAADRIEETTRFFAEDVTLGSISMRSVWVG